MRIYMMEHFGERMSNSKYKDNFIIKGGMLVTAMIGMTNHSTMDIDTGLKNQNLSAEDARRIVDKIKDIGNPVYDELLYIKQRRQADFTQASRLSLS